MIDEGKPITLAAAGAALGWEGSASAVTRRLFRYLRSVEERIGREVMIRGGGAAQGRRYLVTIAAVREACPELVPRRDEVLDLVRRELGRLEERLEEVADRVELVADVVAESAGAR